MKIRILTIAVLTFCWTGLALANSEGRFSEATESTNEPGRIDFDRIQDDMCNGTNGDLVYLAEETALFEHDEFGTIVFKVMAVDNTKPANFLADGLEPYVCKLSSLPLMTMGEINFEQPIALAWCGWVDEDFIYWVHAA